MKHTSVWAGFAHSESIKLICAHGGQTHVSNQINKVCFSPAYRVTRSTQTWWYIGYKSMNNQKTSTDRTLQLKWMVTLKKTQKNDTNFPFDFCRVEKSTRTLTSVMTVRKWGQLLHLFNLFKGLSYGKIILCPERMVMRYFWAGLCEDQEDFITLFRIYRERERVLGKWYRLERQTRERQEMEVIPERLN